MTRSNQERRDFLLNMLDGAQPSHGYDPIERILRLKILDPAMGSGHFLVEATDFLARELLKVLSGEPLGRFAKEMEIKEAQEPYGKTEPEEEDIRWARREVVEKCIFGVDLNPLAVELAKLSLWLYTVSRNRPLNFLDHHLRCGNSLIGANIANLAKFPELKKQKAKKGPVQIGLFESIFREKISILLKSFELIETHPSDTVQQIREKERLYQDFRTIVSRFQDVANVWTSVYFGNEIDFGTYQRLQTELRSPEEKWKKLSQEPWFKKAKDIAEEKDFFHWDLEFPEVFFEGDRRKENPGFDAVIGNPPYGSFLTKEERSYTSVFYESSGTTFDVFGLFIERGTSVLKNKQFISLIVPSGWLTAIEHIHLRTFILSSQCPQKIVHLPYDVFPDAYIDCIVYVARKQKPYPDNICLVKRFGIREVITAMPQSVSDYQRINISPWFTDIDKMMVTEKNVGFWMVQWSRSDNFLPAGEIIKVSRGITPFKKAVSNDSRHTEKGFFGSVGRYDLQPVEFTPVIYDPSLSEYKPSEFFCGKRLIIRRIISRQHRIHVTLVTNDFVMNKSYLPAIITNDEYQLEYVLAILNSRLLSRAFVSMSEIAKRDDFPQLDIATVRRFPIRRIEFTTPKNELYHILKKGKQIYGQYLSQKDSDSIFEFVDYQLSQIPECTDILHYLLAFLVEQMIDMNTNNREEIKGFFAWLESQLKIQPDKKGNTGIEALSSKTNIKNYLGDYQKGEGHLSFEEFWKILEKNRIHTNLKSREIFETVKIEYEKSLSTLLPIKEILRKTDWLIDQIVYKLYGLTKEEIKLVEDGL